MLIFHFLQQKRGKYIKLKNDKKKINYINLYTFSIKDVHISLKPSQNQSTCDSNRHLYLHENKNKGN